MQSFIDEKASGGPWSDDDLKSWSLLSHYDDERSGISYFYLQQEHKGIPLFNVIFPVAVVKQKAYGLSLPFIALIAKKVNADAPAIGPLAALEKAIEHSGIDCGSLLNRDAPVLTDGRYRFDLPLCLSSPAKVSLVYVPVGNRLQLAWNVSLDLKDGSHWWNIRVDAINGSILEKDDWVKSCSLVHDFDSPAQVPDPLPGSGTAQYNVFPLPVESPIHGSRQLLNDPSLPLPSPFGWHDTSGTAGPDFNITKGNNVYAYEDANADNLPGYSPDGGPSQVFNYPFIIDSGISYNRNAAITNLFYLNNYLHDLLYTHGFTESAGNFQNNNYGRGGQGADAVNAEAMDGGGTNNANFATPDDGQNPRMQMYIWSAASQGSCSSLEILSPTTIAGFKTIGTAAYNPATAFNITAQLVLAQDGIGTSTDGCSAFTNAAAVAGKIAVIDRGNCNFVDKTINAQAAGAVGVIVVNNVAGSTPPTMTGTPSTPVNIPTVSITQSQGGSIKTQLNGGTTVTGNLIMCFPPAPRDASFDNGIVAHEYGHGLSNRLTGGPAASSCLSNAEQGGEGWSDWLALITTIEPSDSGAMARGIGTFAVYQSPNGGGIRRYPYSTNMSVNPQTYAQLGSSSTVHQRGEIWCSAIWDMTWFLIRDFGMSNDVFYGNGGNNISMRLVLEGMKLQPCSPGYIDARDAILLADDILYGSAHRCQIWEAFARRGMGYYAAQGSSNAVGDETADFTFPPFCFPPVTPPDAGFSSLTTQASCPATIRFMDQSSGNPQQWWWDFGDGTYSNRQNPEHTYAQPGLYSVSLKVTNTLGSDSLKIFNYISVSGFDVHATATDTSVCAGDTIQLSAGVSGTNALSGYQLGAIPYAPLSASANSVSLSDDQVSSALPIGFNFNFFGNIYQQFYISSNGFIGFSPNMPNGCCNGQLLPTSSAPNDVIALAWNDLNPSVNSSVIDYFLTGTAPNRRLVVRFQTYHYNGTDYPVRGQIHLCEGSNAIELHTENIAAVPEYATTQGIENKTGTYYLTPPGRNASVFSASNDAWRFEPYAVFGYQWSPSQFFGVDSLAGPKVSPPLSQVFSVVITAPDGCTSSDQLPVAVSLCSDSAALTLNVLIEGYVTVDEKMNAVLYLAGLSTDSTACDSLTVELRNQQNPSQIEYASTAILKTDGIAQFHFPAAVFSGSFYIVVRMRNGIETWSKLPVTMIAHTTYDFKDAP